MKTLTYTKNSIITLIIAAASMLMTGCAKLDDGAPAPHKVYGYLVVTCDNCQLQYGMPDQYKQSTVTGTSNKYAFTYESGYTLVSYITPLGEGQQNQNIEITVYNNKDKVVYHGTMNNLQTQYWETRVLLPSSL